MNRLVTTSSSPIDPAALPPRERAAASPTSPARILFLHGLEVGFATTTGNLEHYCSLRDDIDAVHVRLVLPRWLKLACAQLPIAPPLGELDFRYLRHMLFWRRYLRTLLGHRKPLPLEHFDVVHIMTQQRALILNDFLDPDKNHTKTKFVVNLDATLRNWSDMRGGRRYTPPIDLGLETRIFAAADAIACASEWVANSAQSHSSVDPRKVIIHKPCARFPSEPTRRPRTPGSPLNIVFIGGNWQDKGGDRLVRWHQERWADRAVLHIISGTAPPLTGLKNVIRHGRMEHAKLVGEFLPAMDIFFVPTKWDTFLIAAQEAQACGVPVVTTRTGGVPEVVQHGVTGFLCDHDASEQYLVAADKLINDAPLRERMSLAAMHHARTNLSADLWHNHLLNQLVALAHNQPIHRLPTVAN